MPFTPFHFGPSACLSLPLRRYIDVPVFILANVVIDTEPLLVMIFNFSYPLHGLAHTFAGAAIIGLCFGFTAFFAKEFIEPIMKKTLRLRYTASLKKYTTSAILGSWFHVLLDSPLYIDIRPFYPFSDINPFLGIIRGDLMYKICAYAFIPAMVVYVLMVIFDHRKVYAKRKHRI